MLMFYISALETDEDKETFTQIYEEHKTAAMKAALRKCGNQDFAEEAVQETFLQIIRGWEKFLRIPCNERRFFIVRVVGYRAIDIMNRESAYVSMLDEDAVASDGEGPDDLVERWSDVDFAAKCMGKLPESYKTVLELRFRHGLKNREIARLLGISENNAAVRFSRAIAKLRKVAEQKGLNGDERA